jgi:hypothetical protein
VNGFLIESAQLTHRKHQLYVILARPLIKTEQTQRLNPLKWGGSEISRETGYANQEM